MLITSVLCDFGVCAVDVFILITGYFLSMCGKRYVGKPLYLILMTMTFSIGMYLFKGLAVGFDNIVFSWSLVFPANYFVTLYTVLYIISPYINKSLDLMETPRLTAFIILIIALFSLYPTLLDVIEEILNYKIPALSPIGAYGSQWGYNIVNFILLYCLGAYLRRCENTGLKDKWWPLIFLGAITLIFVWHTILGQMPGYNSSAHNYHNPIVILSAIALFMIFRNIHIRSNIINFLAKAAFACYIFHLKILSYIHIGFHVGLPPYLFLIYMLVVVILLYVVSVVVWKIFDVTFKPLFNRLNKIEIPFSSQSI